MRTTSSSKSTFTTLGRGRVLTVLALAGVGCQAPAPPATDTGTDDSTGSAGTSSEDGQSTESGSASEADASETASTESGSSSTPESEASTDAANTSETTSVDESSTEAESGSGSSERGESGGSWEGCGEFVLPADCTVPDGAVLPAELRCTGLYADWDQRELRCGVQPYAPAYELWSDGAGKERYVWLPPGETIDVSDPDGFDYPVGTRFWKEFHVGEPGNQRLGETRYLLKSAAGWLYTTYVWNDDDNAIQENDGVEDLFGSGHTVPTRDDCNTCHDGRSDFVMGWDAIMLGTGATGATLATLAEDGWLSGLDENWLTLAIPGDEIERAALGYLHANCGVSCHNPTTFAEATSIGLYLRLNAGELESPHTTAATLTGINRDPSPHAEYGDLPEPDLVYYDFRPLDPARSLALARMDFRGSAAAMPPIASHVVDPAGIEIVTAWIESMTEERGYPAPAP